MPDRRTAISTPENVVLDVLALFRYDSTMTMEPGGMQSGDCREKSRAIRSSGSISVVSCESTRGITPRERCFTSGGGARTELERGTTCERATTCVANGYAEPVGVLGACSARHGVDVNARVCQFPDARVRARRGTALPVIQKSIRMEGTSRIFTPGLGLSWWGLPPLLPSFDRSNSVRGKKITRNTRRRQTSETGYFCNYATHPTKWGSAT